METAPGGRWHKTYLALYTIHLEGLPVDERRALALVETGGASYAEAAEMLGITRDEVRQVVFDGRARLQEGIERSFAALTACSDN